MLVKGPVWGQKSTKWTPRVVANKVSSSLEVGLPRARAQTKVDEVYGPYGSSPNPVEFAPSKFPQTLQYFRKSHKQ